MDILEVSANGRIAVEGLSVDPLLYDFVEQEALPGSGVGSGRFWQGFASLLGELTGRNRHLLERRRALQDEIDDWHRSRAGQPHDPAAYRHFLEEIGYLEAEGPDFSIGTENVDPEIAEIAGPQLVVPVNNARYALNAANARWGSLYDALYGTDALGSPPPAGPYRSERGAKVVDHVRGFLDDVLPLEEGSHRDATGYRVAAGRLEVLTAAGSVLRLAEPAGFAGYRGDPSAPTAVLLEHHGLHLELVIDRGHLVGADDSAGIADVLGESAITAIMDCEDSIAAVDAAEKVDVYRNWLGLMKGDLSATFPKGDQVLTRTMADDRLYVAPDGSPLRLNGRALMLVRNVGHLMTTDAVLGADGEPVPEGMLDAMVTVLAATHDLRRAGGPRNSRAGSVYVVKPKMHGPEEVALADAIFGRVEEILDLPPATVKIGLMDEERRTSLNLKESIRAAASRIAFINTGFLDRTGDEIRTSTYAGVMTRKPDMKKERWLAAYEDHNVDVGLACGLRGRAQIGKGMWAAPDLMSAMLAEKIGHPLAGASCAWVPSPTAATLHATHYFRVDVAAEQDRVAKRAPRSREEMLELPLVADPPWSSAEITDEVENNSQGILGYVVRWVDQGVGCSKVPDIHGVALMEDRATCRISSQHIANWLLHGVVDAEQVMAAMRRMAAVVDGQNAGDPFYVPMAPGFDGVAFRAACALVLEGIAQPSGYTEPILHRMRRELKHDPQLEAKKS